MWLKIIPWVGCFLLGGLLLNAHQEIGEQVGQCNTEKLEAVAQAEVITREAQQRAFAVREAQLTQQFEDAETARKAATFARDKAEQKADESNQQIRKLELEASIDEIPDSTECLNVFVPGGLWDDEDCGASSFGGSGSDQVCTDPASPLRATAEGFTSVTYGDSIRLWGMDRSTIDILNTQLGEIDKLGEGL